MNFKYCDRRIQRNRNYVRRTVHLQKSLKCAIVNLLVTILRIMKRLELWLASSSNGLLFLVTDVLI